MTRPLADIIPDMLQLITVTDEDLITAVTADFEQIAAACREAGQSDVLIGAALMLGCLNGHRGMSLEDFQYGCKVLKLAAVIV